MSISMSLTPLGSMSSGPVTEAVLEHIDDTTGWASRVFSNAQTTLTNLGNLTFDIGYDEAIFPAVNDPSIEVPTLPPVEDVTISSVAFEGTKPTTKDFSMTTYDAPGFTEKDYGISIPEKPDVEWPEFSKEAPSVPDRQVEDIPIPDLPPIPNISEIDIPSPPTFNDPQFTAEVPVADLTIPAINFNWAESTYSSALKTKLGDTLYDNLVSGGSGLPEATEQAIYSRATSRLEEAEQSMMDELSDNVAQRGFDIPPGALMTLTSEAENKILRSRTDLNNDILIQQSNLAQTNTHFIIQQAANLEGICLQYHSETQTRALDAAKFVVTTAVQVHSLKLATYKTRLDAYQILAQVYRLKIEAEVAKATFYRTQIEAGRLTADIQQLYLNAYLSQLEAIKTTTAIYKLRMEGTQLAATIDKLKLDAYATEANVYSTKVGAAATRYDGYKTEISGEALKGQLAINDANVYGIKTEAYKTKTQAELARVETLLSTLKAELAVYESDLQKYKVDSDVAIAEADTQVKNTGLKISSYGIDMSGKVAALDAAVKLYDSKVQKARAQADLSIKSADVAVRAALGEYELAVEVAKGVSVVSGQMAAAAVGAVNASLHASASESRSDSYSESKGRTSNWAYHPDIAESAITEHIYSYSN